MFDFPFLLACPLLVDQVFQGIRRRRGQAVCSAHQVEPVADEVAGYSDCVSHGYGGDLFFRVILPEVQHSRKAEGRTGQLVHMRISI